jgi:hypothetical protein
LHLSKIVLPFDYLHEIETYPQTPSRKTQTKEDISMKNLRRIIASTLPLLLLLTFLTGNANALLKAVGPLNVPSPPASGFPAWYQDLGSLTLEGCLSQTVLPLAAGGGPACVLLADAGFAPASPVVFPTNYPQETFYFLSDAVDPGGVAGFRFRWRAALEAGFATGTVVAGQQITFARIRVTADVPTAGTYTVTHPYGVEVINAPTAGTRAIFFTRDIGVNTFPTGPLAGDIGPFLTQVGFPVSVTTPTGLETYIGNPNVELPVTGSPTGNNFVRIDGPIGSGIGGPGVDSLTITGFTVAGKIFPGSIASLLNIDRATYYRDALSAHIDTFVTATPAAIPIVSGTGLLTTAMTQDVPNSGKFWGHIHSGTPGLIPTSVTITNNLDVPASIHVAPLVDSVTITEAMYNFTTKALTIKAVSSDELAPPTLTASSLPVPTALTAGSLVVPLTTTIPPTSVTVTSSMGGTATLPVTVMVAGLPPVAVADTATTIGTTPVVINVLANDTAEPGTLDPTKVVTAASLNGTAVAHPDGTVTFTATAGFTGTATFTYTVTNIFNQASNAATVSVTVSAAAAPATGVTLITNKISPQIVNTPVTFFATGSGGTGPYEYRFWDCGNNGTCTIVQDYSTNSSWTLTTAVAGIHQIVVHVRNAGSAANLDAQTNITYSIIALPAATAVTLFTDKVSPQIINTPVTFVAFGSGGSGTYEYRFWDCGNNGTCTVVQDYSTNPAWTLTTAVAGIHQIVVHARSAGSTANLEAQTNTTYSIIAAPPAAASVTLFTDKTSPQIINTPVTFAASATGGSGTYEYRFWDCGNNGTCAVVQDYSITQTWTLSPSVAGLHQIVVHARNTGSVAQLETQTNISFLFQ